MNKGCRAGEQEPARKTHRKDDPLGQCVGLSRDACWRRVKDLESTGVIPKRVALLDPDKLDLRHARVADMAEYDRLYKRLMARIELPDVSASFATEEIKATTALPLGPAGA